MSDEFGLLDKTFLPKDDFQHPVGEDPNWNESYYWVWADTKSEIAGFSRIGIKGNNGYMEALNGVCLGGTRIAFSHTRLPVKRDHTELSAGGLSYERIEPLKRWKLHMDGDVQDIPDGKILYAPRKERPHGWYTSSRLKMALDFEVMSPPQAFNIKFGQEHFEQFGRVSGTVQIAGIDAKINGYGLRDKSWGQRTWQLQEFDFPTAPGAPMTTGLWLAGAFGPDLGFAIAINPNEQGVYSGTVGLVMIDGQNKLATDLVGSAEYIPGTLACTKIHMACKVEGKKFEFHGDVINHIPTKIVLPDGSLRAVITEALVRLRTPEGRETLCIMEYHTKPPQRIKKS